MALGRQGGGFAAALALGAAMALTGALVPAFAALEIREERTGRLVYLAPVPRDKRFEVEFVHSVERTPVREVFAIRPGGVIHLVETRYESFGAGLPTSPDDGAEFTVDGGQVRITGLNRRIGELHVAVSPLPGHVLMVSGRTVALADLAGPGTALSVKSGRAPMAAFLFRGRCWWMRGQTRGRATFVKGQFRERAEP